MIYEANKRIYQKLKTIKLEKKAEKKIVSKKKNIYKQSQGSKITNS